MLENYFILNLVYEQNILSFKFYLSRATVNFQESLEFYRHSFSYSSSKFLVDDSN